MRVKSEEFSANMFYHVYNHATSNDLLFACREDYHEAIDLCDFYLKTPDFSVVAFCLMPNHYHFLIKQNSDCPVYTPMNMIWYRYSRYVRRVHGGKGSIFAGKAQHKLVDKENYLLRLIAYIHLNPVSAGFVKLPEEWEWSNYPEWAGLRDKYLFEPRIRDNYGLKPESYKVLLAEIYADKQMKGYLIDDHRCE